MRRRTRRVAGVALLAVAVASLAVLGGHTPSFADHVSYETGDFFGAGGLRPGGIVGGVTHFRPSSSGPPVEIEHLSGPQTHGFCLDPSGNLYSVHANRVQKFGSSGGLLSASWVGPLNRDNRPAGCVATRDGDLLVGQAQGPLLRFDTNGALVRTYTIPAINGLQNNSLTIELAPDQCSLLFVSPGTAGPPGTVRRFDVCTGQPLADFASCPIVDAPALDDSPAHDLVIAPNGEVFVPCGESHNEPTMVIRFSSSGTPLQIYPGELLYTYESLCLDADGVSFWTGARGREVPPPGFGVDKLYRINILTGARQLYDNYFYLPQLACYGGSSTTGPTTPPLPTPDTTPVTKPPSTPDPNLIVPNLPDPNSIVPNLPDPNSIVPNVPVPNPVVPNVPVLNPVVPNVPVLNPVVPNVPVPNLVVPNVPVVNPVVPNVPVLNPVVPNVPVLNPVVPNVPVPNVPVVNTVVPNVPVANPVVPNVPVANPVVANVPVPNPVVPNAPSFNVPAANVPAPNVPTVTGPSVVPNAPPALAPNAPVALNAPAVANGPPVAAPTGSVVANPPVVPADGGAAVPSVSGGSSAGSPAVVPGVQGQPAQVVPGVAAEREQQKAEQVELAYAEVEDEPETLSASARSQDVPVGAVTGGLAAGLLLFGFGLSGRKKQRQLRPARVRDSATGPSRRERDLDFERHHRR